MSTTPNLNANLRHRCAVVLLAFLGALSAAGCATRSLEPQAVASRAAAPDFRLLVERYGPAVVRVSATPGGRSGSGFIVSADGHVLSSRHVLDGTTAVTVRLPDQREFKARVVGMDKGSDVALLKIDAANLPTVRLGSARAMRAGDWVVAIGSPYGFESTATAGIVSATARTLPDGALVPFLQSDVAVNPGNSGGPLFNLEGEVVGINSQIFSTTGAYHGISFAIPIEIAVKVRDAILRDGRVVRGTLGFDLQELNPALAASFGLPEATGALVTAVASDGPAASAGLASGDVVMGVDATEVKRSADLSVMIAEMKPGTTAALRIWRNGAVNEVKATIGEDAEASDSAPEEPEPPTQRLNLALRPLTPAEEHLIDVSGGLLVDGAHGSAARAGIQPGDVILAVNGTPVRSAEELHGLYASAKSAHVALLVQRADGRVFVPVEK